MTGIEKQMKQLVMIVLPASQRKLVYNIAAKTGCKVSLRQAGKIVRIMVLLEESILDCNLVNLPPEAHKIYHFLEMLRDRKVEYSLEIFTHSYKESRKRDEYGVFGIRKGGDVL